MAQQGFDSLQRKTVLVTGAQQGIGRAIAMAMGGAGANVVANYYDDDIAAQNLSKELEDLNVTCQPIKADLSNTTEIERMFATIEDLGGIDVLVNNAAIFPRADFISLSTSMWQQTLDVNLTAPFICAQHAARLMIDGERPGSIINIVSGAAFRSSPQAAHYVSSKAGLVGLTRAIALELAPHSIRVNAVAPGLTDTAQPRFGMTEQQIEDAAQLVPLGKIAVADDIAPTVCFLASESAAHITGQTLHINGGQYLT